MVYPESPYDSRNQKSIVLHDSNSFHPILQNMESLYAYWLLLLILQSWSFHIFLFHLQPADYSTLRFLYYQSNQPQQELLPNFSCHHRISIPDILQIALKYVFYQFRYYPSISQKVSPVKR